MEKRTVELRDWIIFERKSKKKSTIKKEIIENSLNLN